MKRPSPSSAISHRPETCHRPRCWPRPAMATRPATPWAALGLVLLWGLVGAVPAGGQYVDTAASCLLCHQTPIPQNDFCTVASAAVWSQHDKHRQAFYLLHETRPEDPAHGAAKRALVQQILGFDLREVFVDDRYTTLKTPEDESTRQKVALVKACLRCHATWPHEADAAYGDQPPVPLELGVSCQACHGPAERWDLAHRLPAWRLVPPEVKASLGFYDCRSVRGKTLLCASCHVGNLAEQRFVRHEWYAAGHPPLPSFHLARFTAQMPPHWRPWHEKGSFALRDEVTPQEAQALLPQREMLRRAGVPADALRASYRDAHRLPRGDVPPEAEAVQAAVLSAASVAEAYVQLVAAYASAAEARQLPWPELALYDCAACHHPLRKEGRGGGLAPLQHPPGRPGPAVWPTTLLPAVLAELAQHDAEQAARHSARIEKQWQDLVEAMIAVPLGTPRPIAAAAQPLAAHLAELGQRAAGQPLDAAAAHRMGQLLSNPQAKPAYDFEMARQRAWAWLALAQVAFPNERTMQAAPLVTELEARLALRLPQGPDQPVMDHLPTWLKAAATYDPHWFQERQAAFHHLWQP